MVKNENTIDVKIELQENDDCNSTKSFKSTSTTHSCTSKRKSTTNIDKNKFKKSRKPKLNTNQSSDKNINCNSALIINLDDSKLACNSGIITPSTSSCASSTSSNFSKSPDSIGTQPCKSKDYRQEAKPINDSQTQSIDAFGNFLINQMDKSCELNSLKEENDYQVTSLEQLLTKQWDMGASLCHSLSTNLDCMDLLDLLYKCKQDNLELEKNLTILEKTNSEYEQMNKKLSKSFNSNDDLTPIRKLNQTTSSERYISSSSFNKAINDQVKNHVITNKSSFQPDTSSLNYSNLIQQSLNYLHSKSPHISPTVNNNSLVNLYNKQMQTQSSAQSTNLSHFQTSNTWNPAISCNSSSSQTATKPNLITSQNVNTNSSLSCILNQNQLLQSFQQLNPMQQQQIASYYYMAATSNPPQTIQPTTTNNFNN